MSNFLQEYQKAQFAQRRGDFRESFSQIVNVSVSNTADLLRKTALIAEAGIALMDFKIVEYAIYLLEHNSREFLIIPSVAPYYWFNLATLKANLLAISEHKGMKRCLYQREKTRPVREAYSKALESNAGDKMFQAMVLKVHARFVLGLGRDWETFALLNKSMELNPDDERVVFERAEVLSSLVGCVPVLEKDLLSEGHYYLDLLQRSSQPGRTAGAPDEKSSLRSMAESIDLLRAKIGEKPENEFSFSRGNVLSDNDAEHYAITHALQNRLYLSPCADCLKCDLSVGDAMGLGPGHVFLGNRGAGHDLQFVRVLGRLMERYRSLRLALAEHDLTFNKKDVSVFSRLAAASWTGDRQSQVMPLEEWQSMEPGSMNLVTALIAAPQFFDSISACLSSFINKSDNNVSLEKVMQAIEGDTGNPAFHAFWDLWQDGQDGIIEGAELPRVMAGGILSEECEKLCLNPEELSRKTVNFMRWLRYLIGYFIRIYDREAMDDKIYPPVWSLEGFLFPLKY